MANLNGKVIVVAGASGRLGRGLMQRFLRDGAAIAAIDRTREDLRTRPLPEGAVAYPVHVYDEERLRACFEEIKDRFGRVDALVHAIGMWAGRPLMETSLEQWEELLRVNLTSTFLCFREAVRAMEGSGCLIAFASATGADGGRAEQSAYAAAKAGVIRLVEAVSAEHAEITAHAIAPSLIRYDPEGRGVDAADLIELTCSLIEGLGPALDGATLRAYGTGA
jgi:3-oxoacyl-[acyl-carrier protein] reductase